MIGNEEVYSLN